MLQKIDFILIDDDSLIHEMWKMQAEDFQKQIKTFFTVEEFLHDQKSIPFDTPIYLDVYLANGERGDLWAEKIFKAGYQKIWLASGLEAEDLPVNPYILGVVDKQGPFEGPI